MSDGTTGGPGDLRVEGDPIARLLNELGATIEFLRGDHSQLTSVLSDVTAGWRGAAATQFATGQGDVNVNLDRLIQALTNLQELVQMSRDGFQAEEEERLGELRNVTSDLQNLNPSILNI
ncbi:WXG100 family type VII secretion target [Streptomyces sp. 7-21]|jgi:WXG100 family type VII secretion target|uniref:WXG100 family type VII secretion target n=1 Tax=Streptomyces sp. 7-21 TaxID=2802283 RepID=UPI00191E105A|nr:WXG100 family type VII secretion target [Streptomyces sp. 7-21]MBL1068303.1 WXG100 family type VII secretion target [Streptomyces sp. 7-21]